MVRLTFAVLPEGLEDYPADRRCFLTFCTGREGEQSRAARIAKEVLGTEIDPKHPYGEVSLAFSGHKRHIKQLDHPV